MSDKARYQGRKHKKLDASTYVTNALEATHLQLQVDLDRCINSHANSSVNKVPRIVYDIK